jgi:hypothetical protein
MNRLRRAERCMPTCPFLGWLASDGKPGGMRTGRLRPSSLWPNARLRRRWWRAFRSAPTVMKVIISVTVVLTLSLAIDWIYQVVRKPSELFFPVSGTLYKTASETWRQYALIFRKYSTNMITPELLAAIAQVEGSGNPVVRTYWRWSWITALRGVSAGFERRRDVSDYRRNVCRSAALLHSQSPCRGRWALE